MKKLKNIDKINLVGLEAIKSGKNLLGFSAGVDSTTLFYLLSRHNIDFDLAIVDYGVRKQAKKELKFAKKLAKKYKKKIFIHKAPKIKRNFESNARSVRREFFSDIMKRHNYRNLILAHQLNDRFEWFLMQLTKGCGLNSLLGFEYISDMEDFRIIRPLSRTSRGEILAFLKANKIKYFVDSSNADLRFKRNYFRTQFADRLINEFGSGILQSLDFLRSDFERLFDTTIKHCENDIFIFRLSERSQNLHCIDICAKKLGYVLSQSQRSEIVKSAYSCIIGDRVVIDNNEVFVFVAGRLGAVKHSKKFREILRVSKIPPKIRGYVDSSNLPHILKNMQDLSKCAKIAEL